MWMGSAVPLKRPTSHITSLSSARNARSTGNDDEVSRYVGLHLTGAGGGVTFTPDPATSRLLLQVIIT